MRIVSWLACAINVFAAFATAGLLLSTPSIANSDDRWIVSLFLCPYAVLIVLARFCSRHTIEGSVILATSILVSAVGLPILILDVNTASTAYFSGFVSIFALMVQGALVLLLCLACVIASLIRRFVRPTSADQTA